MVAFAQSQGLWTDHLTYNSVNDIAVRGDEFYCAANQGIFIYDISEAEITKRSKLNGLSDIGVNAIAYNKENDVFVVGYKTANIDLISGSSIVNMGDIKRASGYTGLKRINAVYTRGDIAWLATGFGIVEIDIVNYVVNGTYIIGDNGSELEVTGLAFDEVSNRLYAATPNGLYSANIDDPLIFFQFWQKDTSIAQGIINHVAALDGKVFANKVTPNSVEDTVFYLDGAEWKYLPNQGLNKKYDLRSANGYLCVVNAFTTVVYKSDLTVKYNVSDVYFPGNYAPRCATIREDGITVLVGNDKFGLLISKDITKNSFIVPNGPRSSRVYNLDANNKQLYVAPGAIDELWTNTYARDGIFKLDDFNWNWIAPEEINETFDIVNVMIDPKNASKFYAAGWGTGILEFEDDELVQTWNYQTTNGKILGPVGDEETPRTGGIAIDEDENLWVVSSLSERPISVRRADGTWENYSAGSFGGSQVSMFDIAVNQLNQKWIRTRRSGILVMDDSQGTPQFRKVLSGTGNGNLPNNSVLCFEEDLDGEMWIGTTEGMVVLYSPQNIFTSGKSFDAQPVLFEEEGVVQRLLGTEAVQTIAVDGANKKWFGTLNSGVFYTSEDGTETIYHFTVDNSPLLSNTIVDIEIDDITGEVYIGTSEGIVSFRGSATRGFKDYTDVYAYPNPVRPDYVGPIYIKGLVTNARVKITDVAGNIVYETVAEGGQASWDGKNLDGSEVVSGVYMAYITDDLGSKTTVTKILIVR